VGIRIENRHRGFTETTRIDGERAIIGYHYLWKGHDPLSDHALSWRTIWELWGKWKSWGLSERDAYGLFGIVVGEASNAGCEPGDQERGVGAR
jgi:hypothetical protein